MQYDWKQFARGSLLLGLDATYLIDYRRGAFALFGDPNTIIADPEDRAGKADLVGAYVSYAKIKANAFASYRWQDLSVRWQTRYISGTSALIGAPTNKFVFNGTDYVPTPIGSSEEFTQHDIIVSYAFPSDLTGSVSVLNILDTDPPFAPGQSNYDYFSGNPLGRVYKIELKKKF